MSPVPTSSWAGLPHSFYSALSPSSYTSFGVSPLPSVSGNLLLPGLLPVMLPCLMCWLRLLALPLQCLLPSIFLMSSCSDRILTCRIKSIRSPAKVGLVVTDLITSPVVSWEGWETPPPPAPWLCRHSLLNHRRGKTSLLLW